MTDQADIQVAETPLSELLRRIPRDAVYSWDNPSKQPWDLSTCSAPIGRLAHQAADALSARPEGVDYVTEVSTRPAAVAYRARIACDILEGFTDGIDGDRLGELARWTTSGRALDDNALLRAFAAPWIAASEEAGWEGDPETEARKDIDRHTLAARVAGVNSFTPDQLAARFAEQNQLRAVQDAERKIRETGIAEEEEGDIVGILLDLPDGSQIWTGECSDDLRQQAKELEEDPVTSGAFIIHAENKGRGLEGMTLLASAANTETAMGLARAYAAYIARQQAMERRPEAAA